jgi:hypothetical protein
MTNRRLTKEELTELFAPLLSDVRGRLITLSGGDAELLWALRRKLSKELTYDERSKPVQRKMLKLKKRSSKATDVRGAPKTCLSDMSCLTVSKR